MHWMQLRAAFEAAVEEPEAQRARFVAGLVLAPEVREELTAMLDADARNHACDGRGSAARLQRLLRAIAGVTGAGGAADVPETRASALRECTNSDARRRPG